MLLALFRHVYQIIAPAIGADRALAQSHAWSFMITRYLGYFTDVIITLERNISFLTG